MSRRSPPEEDGGSTAVRQGFKQTDVGLIPEDWEATALGELGDALIGLTYRPEDVRESGTLVLRSSNIQNDALAFGDNVFVDADIPEHLKVRPGDLLICVRNGSRELIGKSVLLDERTKGMTFGAFMAVYRSPIGELARFLFQSDILKRQINEHLGATINQITNKSLNSFQVPIPPSEAERCAIAAVLSDVDALLGALDRLIAKKRDLKQAAMQQLLTGQTRLPGFESGWAMTSVGKEFEVKLGKMLDAEKNTGAPKPYIGNRAVQWDRIDINNLPTVRLSRAEMDRYRLRRGDLLVCEGGEVGRAAIWDAPIDECYYQKAIHRLRPLRGFNPRFMAALLRHMADRGTLSDFVTQTSIAHLPREKFLEVPIPRPSASEQTAIAALLSDMDAEIDALEQRRAKTAALKQGMMQELLTGRTRLV